MPDSTCAQGVHTPSPSLIEVETGGVCLGGAGEALHVSALGSCIAVALYDSRRRRGALAHVMLPGTAPVNTTEPHRYAGDALTEALRLLETKPDQLTAWLVGGANVLRDPGGDALCREIRNSILDILSRQGITVRGSSLGGNERRSVLMMPASGELYFTVGDGPVQRLDAEPERGDAP